MSRRILKASVAAAVCIGTLLTPLPAVAADSAPSDDRPLAVDELDLSGVDPAAVLALPEVAPAPDEAPVPVAPRSLLQRSTESAEAAEDPAEPAPDVLTAELDTKPFSVLGVTWDAGPDDAVIRYRVRQGGQWSAWEAVAASDVQPDAGRQDAAKSDGRGATDPIVALDSDGVQLWAQSDTGEVTGLKAVLVDPGTQALDASPTAAAISTPGWPPIISRAGWGADESLRTCEPDYSPQMLSAAVHHTASTNDYGPDDVAGLIRGFYAYHTRPEAEGGRGWCDIGYNFLVDKFGRIFEGRAGGVTSTVVGVHTGGFNSRTIGIAAIGEYGAAAVPDVLTEALANLIAWKFSIHGIMAGTTVTMVSGGGASKWPEGTSVTFSTIYGHRDAQLTSCPGQNLYNLLPYLRTRVAELANASVGVSPFGSWDSVSTTPTSITVAGWAADRETAAPINVEVRVDGALSTVLANGNRPDVAAAYPALGAAHGFSLTIPSNAGSFVVCLAAQNVGEGTTVSLGCRRVTVRNAAPIGAVDSVTPSATGVTVSGWVLDPDASSPTQAHVYIDGTGVAVQADGSRPDVAAIYGKGAAHGFTHTRTLPAGDHSICVYSIDTSGGPNTLLMCSTFTTGAVVPRTPPFGSLDSVSVSNTAIALAGWALDPDTTDPIDVHVYVDGTGVAVRADGWRADVAAAFGRGASHGFSYLVNATPGRHDLCVHAINSGPGGHTLLACRTVWVPDTAPIGVVDSVVASGSGITVSGWALDPDTSGPNQVHVYMDGVGTALVADGWRADVDAALHRGAAHGFSVTLPAGPGVHGLCVHSINTSFGPHTLLTCQTVVVTDAAPIGVLDSVVASSGRLTFAGWALDPDTTAPIQVHIYIDGVGVALQADGARADVDAVFGRGAAHGFGYSVAVPAGDRTMCVYAIGAAGGANTMLRCGTVRVP